MTIDRTYPILQCDGGCSWPGYTYYFFLGSILAMYFIQ